MKKVFLSLSILVMLFLPLQVKAEGGSAIRLEFGGTSMTIELNQRPKVVTEGTNIVLKTSTMSVILSLPCKVTYIGSSDKGSDSILKIHNDDKDTPINVFTIDGKKIATLKDECEVKELKRGIYIINKKKIIVK